jgi:aerobic carbon-monoxide dehydrogenase medium subunit
MAGRGHSCNPNRGLNDTHMAGNEERGLLADHIQVVSSVEEALALLAAHRGNARLIAGGTVLMPLIERGECTATHLVDVSRVCAMRRIALAADHVVIGGAVTLAALTESAVVRAQVPVLYEAALAVEGDEVRAAATLVGRMVAAEGSAEGSVALVALDAEAQITNLTGSQWMPVASLFVRSGVSRVDSTTEIVTAVRVPAPDPACGTAIGWIERPGPQQPSPLVLALVLALTPDRDTVRWGSVAMGTEAGIPAHVGTAEAALAGASVADPNTRERVARLVAAAGADAVCRSDTGGSIGATHGVDEASRDSVRQTILRLVQGCYDQALAAATVGGASGNGHRAP